MRLEIVSTYIVYLVGIVMFSLTWSISVALVTSILLVGYHTRELIDTIRNIDTYRNKIVAKITNIIPIAVNLYIIMILLGVNTIDNNFIINNTKYGIIISLIVYVILSICNISKNRLC